MIAQDIIVTVCIFNLLNYDNIFGKKLEHDTFDPAHCGGPIPGLALKFI